MRKQLHIGEVAQLLGITPKAIRHYQKIGLLAEPERTETGYRLYDAQDLLRLHSIRRLQSFGLSLNQIKVVLGEPKNTQNLNDILHVLDQELEERIQELQQRREKIQVLLEENIQMEELLVTQSPSLRHIQQQLAPYREFISSALWEQEAQVYALLDSFEWSQEYQQNWQSVAQTVMQHFTDHPDEYRALLTLGERFISIADLSEEAPEVAELAKDFVDYFRKHPFLLSLEQEMPQIKASFAQILAEMITPIYSSAQFTILKALTEMMK